MRLKCTIAINTNEIKYMSKAFTKETDQEDDDQPDSKPLVNKNYVTPQGYLALQNELRQLLSEERPKIVETVRWAAGNGDRSENGDYIYGKRRLREIDRRVRYLTKQLDKAQVVDPKQQQTLSQIFFGATVTYKQNNIKKIIKIVGIDEANLTENKISWISPIAKALIKSRVGDIVEFKSPAGIEKLEILAVQYLIDK